MTKLTILGAMVIVVAKVTAADLPIIAHWSFDNDREATILLDGGSNKINVPLIPAKGGEKENVKTVQGVVGQALELTGEEKAFLSVKNENLSLQVPFSIAFWAKIKNEKQASNAIFVNAWDAGIKGYRILVSWGMLIYQWGDGVKTNSFTSTYGSVLPNRWYHLAVVNDGKMLKLYINGSLNKSMESDNLQPAANDERCGIGNYFMTRHYRFVGLLDDFYIFGKALSDDEVFDLAAKQDTEATK